MKKLEHEMMRTPAQARHIDAISRLPELVRILRTYPFNGSDYHEPACMFRQFVLYFEAV